MKSLAVFFFAMAAVAPASTLATCSILRFSLAAGDHQTAAAQNSTSGSCDQDFSEQITFQDGTVHTVEKRAIAVSNISNVKDDLGFFGSRDEFGYTFGAVATVGGNGFVNIGDLYPGEPNAFDFAFGRSEVTFDFYERTFFISNPQAHTGRFEVDPIVECFSLSIGLGSCSVDWSTEPVQIGGVLTGVPFTLSGAGSVFASGEEDAQQANFVMRFEDPRSYVFTVRDAQGNEIPESEWDTGSASPEPLSILLVGGGLLGVLLLKRARAARA